MVKGDASRALKRLQNAKPKPMPSDDQIELSKDEYRIAASCRSLRVGKPKPSGRQAESFGSASQIGIMFRKASSNALEDLGGSLDRRSFRQI